MRGFLEQLKEQVCIIFVLYLAFFPFNKKEKGYNGESKRKLSFIKIMLETIIVSFIFFVLQSFLGIQDIVSTQTDVLVGLICIITKNYKGFIGIIFDILILVGYFCFYGFGLNKSFLGISTLLYLLISLPTIMKMRNIDIVGELIIYAIPMFYCFYIKILVILSIF